MPELWPIVRARSSKDSILGQLLCFTHVGKRLSYSSASGNDLKFLLFSAFRLCTLKEIRVSIKSTHLIDAVPPDLLPGLSDPEAWSRPPEPFLRWLKANSGGIIEEWVDRLACLSPSYRKRPREELVGTVTGAFEANMEALESGKLGRIESFIDYITEKRLVAGFLLSDVQKAFELFRTIVVNRLDRSPHLAPYLLSIVRSVNACLSYTIHRFSDHFQHMHEAAILAHAQNLEREISIRTAE